MSHQPNHERQTYPQGRSKIGRLPDTIREQLNTRIRDGWNGNNLIAWLHEQPEVKQVLAKRFRGRPIIHQNLTDWRHGRPYEEWCRESDRREMLRQLPGK